MRTAVLFRLVNEVASCTNPTANSNLIWVMFIMTDTRCMSWTSMWIVDELLQTSRARLGIDELCIVVAIDDGIDVDIVVILMAVTMNVVLWMQVCHMPVSHAFPFIQSVTYPTPEPPCNFTAIQTIFMSKFLIADHILANTAMILGHCHANFVYFAPFLSRLRWSNFQILFL